MIRALTAMAAVALGGSTLFPPPTADWLFAIAVVTAVFVVWLVLASLINWIAAYRRYVAERRDARRRAAMGLRWR